MARSASWPGSDRAGTFSAAVAYATVSSARANGPGVRHVRDLAHSALELGEGLVGHGAVHGERDALGDLTPVVVLQVGVDGVGLLPRRHGLGTRARQRRADEWCRQRQQAGGGEHGDEHRPGHDQPGDPHPSSRGDFRRASLDDRQGLDPRPQDAEQARRHEECREGREDADHRARCADRVEEALRHHDQGGHRTGDRQAGEEGGPAGGRDHALVRGLGVAVESHFLAEARHQEQCVVDRQAEAERGGDVEREERGVDEGCHDSQRQQGPDDREAADDEWQSRRNQAAEDDQQQDRQDRKRDQLGVGQIAARLVVDLVEAGGKAAIAQVEQVGGDVGTHGLVGQAALVLHVGRRQLCGERQGFAIRRNQRGSCSRVLQRIGHVADVRRGGEPIRESTDLGSYVRVLDPERTSVRVANQDDDRRLRRVSEVSREEGAGSLALGVRVGEAGGLEVVFDAVSENDGDDGKQCGGHQHSPRVAPRQPRDAGEHQVRLGDVIG